MCLFSVDMCLNCAVVSYEEAEACVSADFIIKRRQNCEFYHCVFTWSVVNRQMYFR